MKISSLAQLDMSVALKLGDCLAILSNKFFKFDVGSIFHYGSSKIICFVLILDDVEFIKVHLPMNHVSSTSTHYLGK